MHSIDWVGRSLVAMIAFVPIMFLMGFFGKNFQVKTELMVVAWQLGTISGICSWLIFNNRASDILPTMPLIIIFMTGITFGTLANICYWKSIVLAPNPGLPIAIVNINSIAAFAIAPLLAALLPKYFDYLRFDIYHLIGIILTVCGVSLILVRR